MTTEVVRVASAHGVAVRVSFREGLERRAEVGTLYPDGTIADVSAHGGGYASLWVDGKTNWVYGPGGLRVGSWEPIND